MMTVSSYSAGNINNQANNHGEAARQLEETQEKKYEIHKIPLLHSSRNDGGDPRSSGVQRHDNLSIHSAIADERHQVPARH